MRETFELMLRTAELEDAESLVWPHAALARLPAEDVEVLKRLGLLDEIEPASGLVCTECEEACWVQPRLVPSGRGKHKRPYHYCRRSREAPGPIWFEIDELRRWAFRKDRLADLVAAAADCAGTPVELCPGRLYLLGTAKLDVKTRELFLARGVGRGDARETFGGAVRLKAALRPAVLTLAGVPPEDLLPGRQLPARPLLEVASFDAKGLHVALDGAFPTAEPSPWADIPNEPITLDTFMAKYCEKRSRTTRRYRRKALLAAAWHGTVSLPPLAEPHRSGQANKYFVQDLLNAWQGFLDEGVDLPPLLPREQRHFGQPRSPADRSVIDIDKHA